MLAVLVVVDNGAIAGLSPVQIADYASLRLLAPQVKSMWPRLTRRAPS